jgi:YfiH family protein
MQWELPSGVHALCTTRMGGVSKPPFDSLNLGTHVQDDPQDVAANRHLLTQQLGVARPVFLTQVHGVDAVELHGDTPNGTVADACWTRDLDVACTIMVADCLPLLLTNESGQVVAAAHAGWRGLAAGVLEKTLEHVCQAAVVLPQNVRVWLGPCIGLNAFEVGRDVLTAFVNADLAHQQKVMQFFKPHPQTPEKWLFDLAGMARWRLQMAGVASIVGNDSSPQWCTVADPLRLFSYRRDGVTGRFAVCIWRSRSRQ